MSQDVDECTTVYDRLRAVQVDGSSLVESLASFMRERAHLEEQYSQSFGRLSKQNLVFNGANRRPLVVVSSPRHKI